jgi:vesicle-associated membrane protein 7
MALVYALVARGNKILAEHTDSSGNFTTVTQSILDRIPDKDAKCTYVYDRCVDGSARDCRLS